MTSYIPLFFLAFLLTGCSTPPPEQIPISPQIIHELTTLTENSIEQIEELPLNQQSNTTTEQKSNSTIKQPVGQLLIKEIDNTIPMPIGTQPVGFTIQQYQPKAGQPLADNNDPQDNIEIEDPVQPTTFLRVEKETYSLPYQENLSVYDVMQQLSAISAKQFYFDTKQYSGMGKFVKSINGLSENTREGMYWIYYINGQPAKTGISNYIIHEGDLIEWKYEKSKF